MTQRWVDGVARYSRFLSIRSMVLDPSLTTSKTSTGCRQSSRWAAPAGKPGYRTRPSTTIFMFGPGADRAFQQVSRPGLFEDCQGFLKIEGNPVMRRGLKIEGNPVMRRGATGHRNQCETIELVTQGSCRSSHARSSTSVIGFEGQLMPRCVARSRRPLQRLRPRSPAPDVQRALAPNSRERDTPGPQPARQGPNGQRSPVILSTPERTGYAS